jgi:nicotinamide-nucleotide amidase
MKVILSEIIAVGSELLGSSHPETNSLFLAEKLAGRGIEVRWKTIVRDVHDDIAFALNQAIDRAKVVILTGGLGSTIDDCTREVVAEVTGRPLRRRKRAVDLLRSRYASYGRELTSRLIRQANIPLGAKMLENPVGSAFGFLAHYRGGLIVALPGVSLEGKAMFDEQVAPTLDKHLKQTHVLNRQVFQTFGQTESEIDDRLRGAIIAFPSITFGLLTSPLGVTVTVSIWSALPFGRQPKTGKPISSQFENAVVHVRSCLGEWVYAEGNRSMEEIVGQHLLANDLTLAVAESCTGGLIGHRLTQIPGSSRYLDRALVCYSNQAKQELLDVPKHLIRRYGAVSSLVARAMARGVRRKSKTVLGLSVTGIAGPGGGSKQKPVGLVFIGIDGPGGTRVRQFHFQGDRPSIKMRASQAALEILRQYLLHKKSK